LTDSYYPGWNAFVDGMRRPVWRANSLFRAVEVPPGVHTLIFRYQPASVRWGIVISLASVVLAAMGLFIERRYLRYYRPSSKSLSSL
ncbi:MAG: YfhO family protein, partial [Candidatus Hydrogenedentota bacterium]